MNRRTALKALASIPVLGLLVPKAEAQVEAPDGSLPVLLYTTTPDGLHMAAVYNHPATTSPCSLVPVYTDDTFQGINFIWGEGMNRSTHFFRYISDLGTFDGGTAGHKISVGPYQHVAAFIRRHTAIHNGQHHVAVHTAYQQDDRPPVYALYARQGT